MRRKYINDKCRTNISYKIGGSFNKFTSFITSSSKQQHVIIYINGKKYANEE